MKGKWAAIFFVLPMSLQALDLLTPLQQLKDPAGWTQKEAADAKAKLLAMIEGCELDAMCVQKMLVEVVKGDLNPLYQDYLTFLQDRRDQIAFEATYCNSPENRAVNQQMVLCFKQGSVASKASNNKQQIENQLNNCIKQKMEALASDNIFAQQALMNFSQKAQDFKEVKYWYGQIQKNVGSSQYELYQKCSLAN